MYLPREESSVGDLYKRRVVPRKHVGMSENVIEFRIINVAKGAYCGKAHV